MASELLKQFEIITETYFLQLKDLEDNYFMNGEAINNAMSNKQDKTLIFILINDYTCLKCAKLFINLFRFLVTRPKMRETSLIEAAKYYEKNILQMIKFDKKVKALNTMDMELCLANPSESGLVKILNDFNEELDLSFILKTQYHNSINFNDSYIYDITHALKTMILMIRVLLVNSSYIGTKQNKFFIIFKQLLNWLDITMQEINEKVNNKNY